MSFVHLGIHSEYSIVDSIIRIPELVAKAAQLGMPALALTDLSNVYAAIKFYKTCLNHGIKPILGSELYIQDSQTRVTLLACNSTGWKNLIYLVSQGFIEGKEQGIAITQKPWLTQHHEGLIVLLGQYSDVGQQLLSNTPENALLLLNEWQYAFGDRCYFSLTRTSRQGEDAFTERAVTLAAERQMGVIAHQDVRFMQADDFAAHEARICISRGEVLADESRISPYSPEQYFKTAQQMQQLFADIPQAITNTIEIAKRCSLTLELGKNYLPQFPIPEGFTLEQYFDQVSHKGLTLRLDVLYPPSERGANWTNTYQTYVDRLKFEIETINQMGFPGYFLIVMDFIAWAKNNGVPVGPGRGSGAGSLVAYSLGITDLDPLRYDLLFERFLNPERVSMPDFDIDFCIAGRDRVIQYVAQTYGIDAVSQIITFGTMAAKAVVRDVARVMGKSYGLADRISKLIPKTPGINLQEALGMIDELKAIITNPKHGDFEDASEIWEMALKLEGITRNVGKHAGGILIAPGKITDFSAVYCDEDGTRVSQFDKDDVEAVGLVKFDFLGLRNLTVIDAAMRAINELRSMQGESTLNLTEIPMDDKRTYALLQKAATTAVFQLESTGMKKYLSRLKPTNIDDVIAMCALYRPGPLDAGMVDMYIDRKHGRERITYDHHDLEPILNSTYGVIVYQEQVMQISQTLAGYSLGAADLLRRAMGKKKPEEMAQQRILFIAGAEQKGIDATTSGHIFDLMEKFAGYGFNKSHSAAYGIVAYQTAWLKAHYPAHFMAAVLASEMDNTDNIVSLINDCKQLELTITPPSVNHSVFQFKAIDENTIAYGLGAIKGVGEAAMQSVIASRDCDGIFSSLFDFCSRIDLRKTNKRTLEALIRSGALDCFNQERSALMLELPDAMQAAEQSQQNIAAGMMDLFGEGTAIQYTSLISDIPAWSDEIRLQGEKETLGLYLTGHPIDRYENELAQFIPAPLNALQITPRGSATLFAGLIVNIINFNTRFLVILDDGKDRLEVSCTNERMARYKDILTIDRVVIIEGDISLREEFHKPVARLLKAFDLLTIRDKRASFIRIDTAKTVDPLGEMTLEALRSSIAQNTAQRQPNQRTIPLQFALEIDCAKALFVSDTAFCVVPTDRFIDELHAIMGKEAVQIIYNKNTQKSASTQPKSSPSTYNHSDSEAIVQN